MFYGEREWEETGQRHQFLAPEVYGNSQTAPQTPRCLVRERLRLEYIRHV